LKGRSLLNSATRFPSQNSNAPVRKAALLLLRLSIAIGILVWLEKSGALNFHSLSRLLHIWPLTLAAVAILFLDVSLMAIRVALLFGVQDLSLSFQDALQLTLTGYLFSMLLPGTAGGDVAKFYYAGRKNQGKRPEIAAALLFDRLVGLFSMILLPLVFAPFFLALIRSVRGMREVLWFDTLLAICLLFVLGVAMFFEPFRDWLSRLLDRWPNLRDQWDRAAGAIALYREHRAALVGAMILSLLANCAYIIVTALGLYATSPAGFSLRLLFVAPVGHLINALPVTPGGLGVGEAAFSALFATAGMKGGAGALICVRLWNAAVALIGGAIYLWGIGRFHIGVLAPNGEVAGVVEPVPEPQFDKG
jgi:glycosyltransferase 2 family protein